MPAPWMSASRPSSDGAEEGIGLPVVADLAAAQRALRLLIEVVGGASGRIIVHGQVAGEADAGVHADVEAGPVIDRRNRRLEIGSLDGKIGRLGADRGSDECSADENTFHSKRPPWICRKCTAEAAFCLCPTGHTPRKSTVNGWFAGIFAGRERSRPDADTGIDRRLGLAPGARRGIAQLIRGVAICEPSAQDAARLSRDQRGGYKKNRSRQRTGHPGREPQCLRVTAPS